MSRHRVELAVMRKADGAEVRVATDLYKGRRVLDVRVWYLPAGGADYVPTRKGVTLDADRLPDLIEALANAAKADGEKGD